MLERFGRCDAGSFIVAVDSYHNEVPVGQFFYPYRAECGQYQSLMQLVLKIDRSLDEENVPQSFHTMRTFFPPYRVLHEEGQVFTPRMGKLATFSLRILFRRNAGWQGELTWLEGEQTERFRSVLELITLMDSAIAAKELPSQRGGLKKAAE